MGIQNRGKPELIIKPPKTVDAAVDGETHSSFMYHGKRIRVRVRALRAQCLSFSQARAKVSPSAVSQREKSRALQKGFYCRMFFFLWPGNPHEIHILYYRCFMLIA